MEHAQHRNLHDADRDTLDLLVHLARSVQTERLLVVGSYRDVEVDRVHPLSDALAELRRTGSFLRIPLRGLSVDEVHRMFNAIRVRAPRPFINRPKAIRCSCRKCCGASHRVRCAC
jgi:hypothetical protein